MANQIFKLVITTVDGEFQESVIYAGGVNPLAELWRGFQAAQGFRGVKSVKALVNQDPYQDKFLELDHWTRPRNKFDDSHLPAKDNPHGVMFVPPET